MNHEHSQYDGKLVEGHQAASYLHRGNFADIHGRYRRREAHANPTQDPVQVKSKEQAERGLSLREEEGFGVS